MSKKWHYQGDVNMLDYGGAFARNVSGRTWHVIEFDNLRDCCGDDADGHPTYIASLKVVDLDGASESTFASVGSCCDLDDTASDLAWALSFAWYGAHDEREDVEGNNAKKILRDLRALSRSMS